LENGLKVHQNQWDLLQKLEGINNKTGYNRRQKQSLVFGWLCVFFPIFVSPKWRKLGRQAATASGAETLPIIALKIEISIFSWNFDKIYK
jgi:hypothetical protein